MSAAGVRPDSSGPRPAPFLETLGIPTSHGVSSFYRSLNGMKWPISCKVWLPFWRYKSRRGHAPEKQPAGLPLLQSKAHLHHGDLKIFSPWVSGWFLGWVGGAYWWKGIAFLGLRSKWTRNHSKCSSQDLAAYQNSGDQLQTAKVFTRFMFNSIFWV